MLPDFIGGIFNIIGNSQNADAQREANWTNLRINQMNNDFNAREAEKAFLRESQYNDKIRAEDRDYNSAKAQVERYRAAGLNPTLMMQGQSAGMANSNGVSSSAASAASAAPQQAFKADYGLLGNSIQGFLDRRQQSDLIKEQVNGIRIENQYKAAQAMQEIAESKSRELSNKAKAKLDSTIEGLQGQMMQSIIDSNVQEAKYRGAMTTYQNLVNENVPDDIASQIALRWAQKGYYDKQSKQDIRNIINSIESSLGYKLPEPLKNTIFGAISLLK